MASQSPSPAIKAVSISEEPEVLTSAESPDEQQRKTHLHKAISSRRLHGRLPVSPRLAASVVTKDVVPDVSLAESRTQQHHVRNNNENVPPVVATDVETRPALASAQPSYASSISATTGPSLAEQVKDWLEAERKKLKSRRARHKAAKAMKGRSGDTSSSGSEEESLDALDSLLKTAMKDTKRPPYGLARRSSSKHRKASRALVPQSTSHLSDTEYASDGEALVPSCEVVLNLPEAVGMEQFKKEVLTLTHTLKCKGWRRVPLDMFHEISAERISGALTNAVYMISPPAELPTPARSTSSVNAPVNDSIPILNDATHVRPPPAKLLLRIYGPQVEHLIDRETELSILRRLARQKIGPRLLGTFENGRFEQYFASRTLTRDDIRQPETSRHIAMRLRELHEGIDLEDEERVAGPIVFKNWDKWVARARSVMKVIDSRSLDRYGPEGVACPQDDSAVDWEKRGFVCGSTWDVFESTVQKYREWLYARYGGEKELNKKLVFAHNDTQYGNILRLQPSGKSPLLLPMNEHRQLIVIDFEYASANHRGFEFANHFCEWMANYHDSSAPYLMRTESFPTVEQQRNFLRAYIEHSLGHPSTTPPVLRQHSSSSFVSEFMLDARSPAGASYRDEEAQRARRVESEVEKLRDEARAWRAASHAMWCAWGIVQAKLTAAEKVEADALENGIVHPQQNRPAALSEEAKVAAEEMKDKKPAPEEGEDDEFDYLGYAQQRALLFWGDVLQLGVVDEKEVLGLAARAKRIAS